MPEQIKKKRRVIFDIDDVLWPLNKYTAWYAGVPYEKILTYHIDDNPVLSPAEKARVLEAYKFDNLHAEIPFYPEAQYLRLLANDPRVDLGICSNSFTPKSKSDKIKNLERLLGDDFDKIQLDIHLISVSESVQKKMPEDVYIFVDDSPFNAAMSSARHILMPRRPWNQSKHGQETLAPAMDRVIFYEDLGQCFSIVNGLLQI